MSVVALLTNRPADTLEVFTERCWARALLVREGVMEFQDAVDGLQDCAVAFGLVNRFGQDDIQRIMAEAFGEELPELQAGVDEMVRRLELQDPRDRWQHTGEAPPPDIVRNSDVAGPQRAKPKPYQTPQSTIDAFFYVVRQDDVARLDTWLADHPKDAAFLLKLLEGRKNA
jgi:hypothetical protein